MPTYQFEALDRTGQEIRDVLEAASEEEAQVTIQKMGYFITKISVKKVKKAAAKKAVRPAPKRAPVKKATSHKPAAKKSSAKKSGPKRR